MSKFLTDILSNDGGSPQSKKVEAKPKLVDTKKPTQPKIKKEVDTKQSTQESGGSPQQEKIKSRKADRHNPNLVRQQFRIHPDHDKQFRLFRAEHNLSITEFYELAALSIISRGVQLSGSPLDEVVDTNVSPDDRRLMIWKTKPSIVNLHLQFNPHLKWKPSDDEAAHKFNDVDLRLLEIGFMQTQFNAGFKKINSFKYYVEQIETVIADIDNGGMQDLETYYQFIKNAWEKSRPR